MRHLTEASVATTGGNRRSINGGAFLFPCLRLPASGIEVDIPLVGYFPAAEQSDAGIEPEMVVAEGIADIAGGTDPGMAAALAACTTMPAGHQVGTPVPGPNPSFNQS